MLSYEGGNLASRIDCFSFIEYLVYLFSVVYLFSMDFSDTRLGTGSITNRPKGEISRDYVIINRGLARVQVTCCY